MSGKHKGISQCLDSGHFGYNILWIAVMTEACLAMTAWYMMWPASPPVEYANNTTQRQPINFSFLMQNVFKMFKFWLVLCYLKNCKIGTQLLCKAKRSVVRGPSWPTPHKVSSWWPEPFVMFVELLLSQLFTCSISSCAFPTAAAAC